MPTLDVKKKIMNQFSEMKCFNTLGTSFRVEAALANPSSTTKVYVLNLLLILIFHVLLHLIF